MNTVLALALAIFALALLAFVRGRWVERKQQKQKDRAHVNRAYPEGGWGI